MNCLFVVNSYLEILRNKEFEIFVDVKYLKIDFKVLKFFLNIEENRRSQANKSVHICIVI